MFAFLLGRAVAGHDVSGAWGSTARGAVGASETADIASTTPGEETVPIAEPELALTFARAGPIDSPRLLAVLNYGGGRIEAVDMSRALGRTARDPIETFSNQSYESLLSAITDAPPAARVIVSTRELVAPVDLTSQHIAAGTNFPEHAGEAEVENGPFLFAKLVRPSGPYAAVPVAGRLLDYEAEVAWVTLEPLAEGSMPAWMGLVLCNDYTDRETLIRHVDPWEPESGKGFTTGKSFPGYLPIGNLFVIPRDYRRFAADVELRLYVNGELRQQAQVRQAIWQIDDLVEQTWARREIRWEHRGSSVSLFGDGDTIPARALLLSGTPSGTVFQGVRFGQKVRGVGSWLLGGRDRSIAAHAIDAYLADAREENRYLTPGDRVLTYAPHLGVIDNTIAP